jgi:hypothetical protein
MLKDVKRLDYLVKSVKKDEKGLFPKKNRDAEDAIY